MKRQRKILSALTIAFLFATNAHAARKGVCYSLAKALSGPNLSSKDLGFELQRGMTGPDRQLLRDLAGPHIRDNLSYEILYKKLLLSFVDGMELPLELAIFVRWSESAESILSQAMLRSRIAADEAKFKRNLEAIVARADWRIAVANTHFGRDVVKHVRLLWRIRTYQDMKLLAELALAEPTSVPQDLLEDLNQALDKTPEPVSTALIPRLKENIRNTSENRAAIAAQ